MRTAIALLLSMLATFAGCDSSVAPDDVELALPDIQLRTLDRQIYEVAQSGETRVLNLWATWCTPCRAELPVFDAVAAEPDAPAIVGINVGDSAADAAELIAELGLSFPQVLDPDAQVSRAMRITGMPTTIFVGADGQVAAMHAGELTHEELTDLIAEHLD